MEEQQEAQMGIEEQEQKENNQMDMVSENPIDEERNQPQNSPREENNIILQDEAAEMEEEKVNQEDQNEEFSMENEGQRNEAISEEVEEDQNNPQIDQNQEPSIHEPNIPQVMPRNEDSLQEQAEIQVGNPVDPIEQVQHVSEPVQTQNKAEGREEGQESPQMQIVQQVNINNIEQEQRQKQMRQEQANNAAELARIEQKKAEENMAYTNKIQRLVQSLSESLAKSRNEQQNLRQSNKTLTNQLSNSKQAILQLRKKKMELQMEKLRQAKQLQKLRRQNGDFKEKLTEIQKIGNILVLQSTIQELKLLTNVQKEQIEELKAVNSQQAHNYYQQQFNLLQSYQSELNTAKIQTDALKAELEQLKQEKAQIINIELEIENENTFLKESINTLESDKIVLKNQITAWQKKWESFEDERTEFKRTRELDQKVSQYESERFMGEDNDVQIIPTLSDKEEKNLLLKEYLKLQALYEQSKIKQQQAEIRLKRVLRDSKIQEANAIRKKDYQDLLSRYKKAKSCLEGAFSRLKSLENVETNSKAIRQEVNELLEGNQSRLCQTLIKKTNEQQQLINDKINEMELTDEIITLKRQNAKFKENQIRLEREVKCSEKILYLMNDQLEVRKRVVEEKSKIIEKLIDSGYHHRNQHYDERIAQLQRELKSKTQNLSVYEIKNIILIKENESYLHQVNHWKSLYNEIKKQLSERISVSLSQSQKPIIQTRMQAEGNLFCKQCERRSLELTTQPQYSYQSVQTENNYDLHFQEIKQSLICLKKINKEVETIPESHQKTIRLISDFKDKYEKYIEKYNAKLLELKKEKSENEAWRARARQEIREEFQQIRDIIGNNRLTTALRQAKSLIDYLQKGQEEEEKEEIEEQNNEGDEK